MYEILKKGKTKAPIKSWLPWWEISSDTFTQLTNAADHPKVGTAVAVMPDAHVGYGVSIGCVFPTINAVIPNAVGVDIGCGMGAVDTGVIYDSETMGQKFWDVWSLHAHRMIPTGFSTHSEAQSLAGIERELRATELQSLMETKAAVQLGTLGGGNHFLEAQVDERGHIWFMVHSGSRHTGLRIANYYNALAIAQSDGEGVPRDLAFLRLDDKAGQDYLHDMEWATDFALMSRRQMLHSILEAFSTVLKDTVEIKEYIDCRHNYAEAEEHEGIVQMVHRKGATNARENQLGIIPGSMGSFSYIVAGKGNKESLESCSHGAGRAMGRGAAKAAISQEEFEFALKGTFSKASMGYVDESPQAYKNVEIVMERQSDLVDIVHTLKPLITLKGDSKAKDD